MAETITIRTGSSTDVVTVIEAGPQGPAGSNGANGQGVPVGGTTGQILRKASGTNYDTEWAAAGSGSGSVTSVALAGTGLSISGSPVTTSGTITANVSYGTTAGTATQGNDARIVNIIKSGTAAGAFSGGAGGAIDLSGGNADSAWGAGGAAGSINLSGGDAIADGGDGHAGTNGGTIDLSGGLGGAGGSIDLRGSQEAADINISGTGGSINLSAGNADGGGGGSIISTGGTNAVGGTLNMSASGNQAGGSINTSDGGGSINTSDGGGSISTIGTGSIGFGVTGTRTTLTGTATADRAISLPNAAGTLALLSDLILSKLSGTVVLSPTSDANTTSTTPASVAGMSFTAQANTNYLVIASLQLDVAASGGGCVLDASTPNINGGATANGIQCVNSSTINALAAPSSTSIRAFRATAAQTSSGIVGAVFSISTVRFTAGGTVDFNWALVSSSANTSTLKSSSRVVLIPIT